MNKTVKNEEPVLAVRRLKTYFRGKHGWIQAVDGVNLTIRPGEALGLVGESGCGKSVTALSILRLAEKAAIVEGENFFRGVDLMKMPEREMNRIRGDRIAMVFQEPLNALHPALRAGDQIADVIRLHYACTKSDAQQRAVALLRMAGLPDPERQARAYPHELSAGMAQRVMIAIALACQPELLIADEPTSALDATLQADLLALLREIRRQTHLAMLLIAHDLAVVAANADRVAVMYAGQIIEETSAAALLASPFHPYTRALAAARPIPGPRMNRLSAIPGVPPDPAAFPPGCRFAPRCAEYERLRMEVCITTMPPLIQMDSGGCVRCWLFEKSTE
jgi:oligopeptide/dipeptide ABC transporter ATP-binding protein